MKPAARTFGGSVAVALIFACRAATSAVPTMESAP